MTITDYLRQNNILWTKKKRWQVYFIFNVAIYLVVAIPVIVFAVIMLLQLFTTVWGLNIITVTRTRWLISYFGFITSTIIVLIYLCVYLRLTFHKQTLYSIHKKNPQLFEIEMSQITVEDFERELSSKFIRWYRGKRGFRKFVKRIKLYEWTWNYNKFEQPLKL